MPSEKIEDKTTPGLFTRVSWRKHDEVEGFDAPGHVQVATVNERSDALVRELLDTGVRLVTAAQDLAFTQSWRDTAAAWVKSVVEHRPELTGWYAQHDDADVSTLIRALHKARAQAFPGNLVASPPETTTIEGDGPDFQWFDKPGQLD